MICQNCKAGADLWASLPAAGSPRSVRARNIRAQVTKLHGKCRGGTHCPCQHVGTKHHASAVS